MELKRYDTPEDCYAYMFGLPIEELMQGTIDGLTEDNQPIETTVEHAIVGMRSMGVWGWIEQDTEIIHYWYDPDVADDKMLMHFLAHELAHSTEPEEIDDYEAEVRAEEFGHNAADAFELLMEIKNGTP